MAVVELGAETLTVGRRSAFRRSVNVGTQARLLFELMLETGQRIGDVHGWEQFGGNRTDIRQAKAGTTR